MAVRSNQRSAPSALVAVLITAAVAVATTGGSPASAAPVRRPVRGSRPEWATPGNDLGAAPGSRSVTLTVHLALRDPAGAEALVRAVSDPASPSYGQFVSPADYSRRFEATDADVAAVRAFLTGAGLRIDSADREIIVASGTVAKASTAFGVQVHRYRHRGQVLDAPTAELTVPDTLAGKVQAVAGLDQAGTLQRPKHDRGDVAGTPVGQSGGRHGHGSSPVPPPDAFVNAPPCSTTFGSQPATGLPAVAGTTPPVVTCGYTPSQYQGAYDVKNLIRRGNDGRGVTVAITDAYNAPTIFEDANEYARRHGQPTMGRRQFRQIAPKRYRYGYNDTVDGDLCGEQGWYGEETLDVEAVHAVAPGANILYVGGASCDDPDLLVALHTIIAGRQADIITNSWGSTGEDLAPDVIAAYHSQFAKAAAVGIGVFFSSGDEGDDSLVTDDGLPAADHPATDPLVTAVGGTSLGVGAGDRYQFETGWATGNASLSEDGTAWEPEAPGEFIYGGGGGVSELFAQPWYQQRVVPPSIANGRRALPDISMDGDPQTGMLVGETQTFPDGSVRYSEYRIGGTSLSSPLFAGMQALADQAAGRPHGFANPLIYRLAGSGALRDVRSPSPVPAVVRFNYVNGVDGTDGIVPFLRSLDDEAQTLHVAPGWDNLTGVGTPNGSAYVAASRRR